MLFFEDIAAGQKFGSPSLRVDAAAITAFAAEFDPQPFHLDDAAARRTIFEGLAASGWHTAALTMKLCVASDFRPAGGILGVGGELTWLKPVRPGDELHVEIEILETRVSRSRPGQGLVKLLITTLNQAGEPVQTFTPTLFVERAGVPGPCCASRQSRADGSAAARCCRCHCVADAVCDSAADVGRRRRRQPSSGQPPHRPQHGSGQLPRTLCNHDAGWARPRRNGGSRPRSRRE